MTTSLAVRRGLLGALAGFLAGAAGIAVSEALAHLLGGVTSPLLAVGNRAIDLTPRPLKEWAIETFGSHDKPVLLSGVVVTVALLAALLGVLGTRRPRTGVGGFAVLSLVAAVAAVTDRAATASVGTRLVPVVGLAVVSIGALAWLLSTLSLRSLPPRRPASGAHETEMPSRPAPPAHGAGAGSGSGAAATAEEPSEVLEGGKARLRLPSHRNPEGRNGDEVPSAFDRRRFLQAALAVSAVAVAGGVAREVTGTSAAASRAAVRLPSPAHAASAVPNGATLPVQGITPHVSSNAGFYRVDTALSVPQVPVEGWSLRIHGMVDREVELSFADLLDRRLVEKRITLTCVSNQVGGNLVDNAAWLGVLMKDLLAEAGVKDGADAVKSTSADGMTIGTPLQALTDDRGALVAIGMNGKPLPLEHGFPARMVTPGLYGYVSATKWLVDLEVTRFSDFKAYWTTRGYDAQAPIKTSSRIDVPRSFAQLKPGKQAVAGVAWSQNRGIRKVEVRVDHGPWHEARLAAEDNIDTWRQWVYEWDAAGGEHTLEVRATDNTGQTQVEQRSPIAPNGSTGWDSVAVSVNG